MTVESWLRGHFHGIGNQIESHVLEVAAFSPMEARPTPLRSLVLTDTLEEHIGDPDYMDSLNYALSTLYYSMSTAITGGTKSERRGNRQISIGGYPLTTKDRMAFRELGDKLRIMLGKELESAVSEEGGMFDASGLRAPGKPKRGGIS